MSPVSHCRHCLGDCAGDCLVDDTGWCIHGGNRANRGLSWRLRVQLLGSRRWWRRVFWGVR
jgi:hypothetical protein